MQPVEQPGGHHRGVDVTVPGRAPLHRRVPRPADRRQVLGAQLGLLVLQELQRQPLHRQVVVACQRRQRVRGGAEAVHEDQRQRRAVLSAQVQDLARDHVEERQPATHAQQRLRAGHAHGGAEAAVELDHDRLADGVGRDLVADLDVGERLHVERLDVLLGDHAGLAVLDLPVVVREDLDRQLVHACVPHLVLGSPEPLRCHDSIVGLSGAGVHIGHQAGAA